MKLRRDFTTIKKGDLFSDPLSSLLEGSEIYRSRVHLKLASTHPFLHTKTCIKSFFSLTHKNGGY